MKSTQPGKNEAGKMPVLHSANLNWPGWRESGRHGHGILALIEKARLACDGNTRFILTNPAAPLHARVARRAGARLQHYKD